MKVHRKKQIGRPQACSKLTQILCRPLHNCSSIRHTTACGQIHHRHTICAGCWTPEQPLNYLLAKPVMVNMRAAKVLLSLCRVACMTPKSECVQEHMHAYSTDPSFVACFTRLPQRSSVFNALALPMTMSEDRARVRPTLTRRSSATKPMLPCFLPSRTVLKIATSFSLPCRSRLIPE